MQVFELKVPPVGVFLLAGAAMWGLAKLLPAAAFTLPAHTYLRVMLLLAGGAFAVPGILAFYRHDTTVDPTRPAKATALVISGVYRYTRNPMYLGLLFVLAAWFAYLANVAAVLVLPVFVVYMNRFQIKPEERALQEKFGSSYTRYMSEVRRWL